MTQTLADIKPLDLEAPEGTEETLVDSAIPRPVGYRLLIAMPKIEETFESGIVKAGTTIHHESVMSMVGLVLDMGEQAYADVERFPTGPWCQVGDYVMFRSSTGTRFRVGDQEFRLMNDDSIEAVVTDHAAIKSVL